MDHIRQQLKAIVNNIGLDDAQVTEKLKQALLQQELKEFAPQKTESIVEVYKNSLPVLSSFVEDGKAFIHTGNKALDEYIKGFYPGELIILGGRPASGKTAVMLKWAIQMSQQNPVLFYTADMSKELLNIRITAALTGIGLNRLLHQQLYEDEKRTLLNLEDVLKKYQLFVNDDAGPPISDILLSWKECIADKGIKLIFIDYLQLLHTGNTKANREENIAYIMRKIKNFAKENNVVIIAASSLNRTSERKLQQPRLSDLRESGAIEQMADKVFFIHEEEDGARSFIIAKNRMGPLATMQLQFNYNQDALTIAYTPFDEKDKDFYFSKKRLDEIDGKD